MEKERTTKIDEKELQILWNCGMSDKAIAAKLTEIQGISISQSGVTRARQRLGLSPHFHHNANPKTQKDPRSIYDESRERANQWKKDNPEASKEQFAKWQKENRDARNAYNLSMMTACNSTGILPISNKGRPQGHHMHQTA